MKKRLLLGTALLAAVSAFPQSGRIISKGTGVIDVMAEKAELRKAGNNEAPAISPLVGSGQTKHGNTNYLRPSGQPTLYTWDLLCGSMNTYGMIVSTSRPLQYNPNVNAVSFIHRKSATYQTNPVLPTAAQSGVIVAEISTNWGNSWDSTAIWADATHWGRYPQGGVYGPPGTSISNAYVVGSGPTVSGTLWTGDWYASKQLNVFDDVASTVPGAQQHIPFPPSNTLIANHSWSRCGFSVTDDGLVRSIAILEDDPQALSTVRGFAVVTGSFTGGVFTWTTDTLIPNTIYGPNNYPYLSPDPQMAWNQSGTIGYVVAQGVTFGATKNNAAYQPIVWKMDRTQGSSATWSVVPSIDFNNAASSVSMVVNSLPAQIGTYGDTISIPFLNDYDITVDGNGRLHIAALFQRGATDHPDSLNYISSWSTGHNNPGESYKYFHGPGRRPYIFDFVTDGVNGGTNLWQCMVIDSMSSEGPSASPAGGGYSENPWDNTGEGGAKLGMEGRIQFGRTPSGDVLTISWAESDSAFTNNQFKWNNLPNIKVRAIYAHPNGSFHINAGPEQNVTSADADVNTRSTLHYMSPITSSAAVVTVANSTTVDIKVPLTVTNSNPYSQLTNNTTWYGKGNNTFVFPVAYVSPPPQPTLTVGVADITSDFTSSQLYPNPASGFAIFSSVVNEAGNMEMSVLNSVGQVVKSSSLPVNAGESKVKVDLAGLAEGIYFVQIQSGSQATTKKLVVK